MDYALNRTDTRRRAGVGALKRLVPLLDGEKRDLVVAFVAILCNTGATLAAPIIIGRAVDAFVRTRDLGGVLTSAAVLFGVYAIGLLAAYTQTIRTGTVGRNVLYKLRDAIFSKLQELPVAFFDQNKVGDLISRINNDTDRLNQFFSQALMRFVGNFFLIVGTGAFLLILNFRLGGAALVPALVVLVITQVISPWVKRMNLRSLQTLGAMSADVQENLDNFRVIVAFNRLDYFRDRFEETNERNFKASVGAGIANGAFAPLYAFASALGQMIVLVYGVGLIMSGHLTVGLLISFLLYVNNFYQPLRQLATVWSSFQQSLAAIDRISELQAMSSDLVVVPSDLSARKTGKDSTVLSFHHVSFRYGEGTDVLRHIDLELQRGKTYALVGPTGGGKTTTASLMARLYDPAEGTVRLDGRDIRSYTSAERAEKIGFILQEPFLFSGTVLENVCYGNAALKKATREERLAALAGAGLDGIMSGFSDGPDTTVGIQGEGISLGQRQLIAFVRAVLRRPELLVLDEATANVDTVTEQELERVLRRLPSGTTKVIIAHRLNTIENADRIFFVNGGDVVAAGSFDHAVDMLMHGGRST